MSLSSHVSVPMMISGLILSITFDNLHSLDLIDWKLIFTIFNVEAHFGGSAFLVGVDEWRGFMFVLSGLCGGKSRMLLFDKDEAIAILW
jgi:hypothetical protein